MQTEDFSLTLESVVQGHYIYESMWTPFVGQTLPLMIEDGNEHNHQGVAMMKDGDIDEGW